MTTTSFGVVGAAVVLFSAAQVRAETTGADGGPTAGWRDGYFFLRDRSDAFRLYVRGRAQLDVHTYFGQGVGASALDSTFLFRRLQPEISGEIEHVWTWTIALGWESASLTQPVGAGANARAAAGKSEARAHGLASIPADAFMNFGPHPMLNLQVGQFDAPFMAENRTSDEITSFTERSMAARSLGVPRNKAVGAMFWGEPESKMARYEVGAFLADGTDGGFKDGYDVMWRTLIRPLYFFPLVKDLSIGADLRWGTRSATREQTAVSGFTTAGNFEYWAPTCASAKGLVQAYPNGVQEGRGIEFRMPFFRLEPAFEWIDVRTSTRESVAGATEALRTGAITGQAWYLELGLWLYGKQDLPGSRGVEPLPHADLLTPERQHQLHAFELVLRHEHLSTEYASANRSGAADPAGVDGHVRANLNGVGLTYWWTRHVRLTADYAFTDFSGTGLRPNAGPHFPAHGLNELALRAAVGL